MTETTLDPVRPQSVRTRSPVEINLSTAIALLVILIVPDLAGALTRDQELSQLELQERHLLLSHRRAAADTLRHELEATRDLFARGYVTQLTYNRTRNSYEEARLRLEEAEIQLEQTKFALLRDATRVAVREARKYRQANGHSFVDLYLENASDVDRAMLVDPELHREDVAALLRVEDVFVSLTHGPIVAEPYEARIPVLELGDRHRLTFRLLRDEEAVVVALSYLDVVGETRSIILKKGGQLGLPMINSAQFSQAGELKRKVRYDLLLEHLAEDESKKQFRPRGRRTPPGNDHAFMADGARVNRVSFDGFSSNDTLSLELYIPSNLEPRFIGQPRTFFATVSAPGAVGIVRDLDVRFGDRPVPEEEVLALNANYVSLELTPRGAGELEVLVTNRYQEMGAGRDFRLQVQFANRGTATVHNVEAVINLPYRWGSTVEPNLIESIEPGRRISILVTATPPDEVASATYEMGIMARGQVGNENVESRRKNITIHLQPSSGIAATLLLLGAVLTLIVGIGAAAVRITRR